MPHAKILTYEHSIMEWFLLGEKYDNVHVIFYEQLLDEPELVLKELANFLKCETSEKRVNTIVEKLVSDGLLPNKNEIKTENKRARSATVDQENAFGKIIL